MFLTLPVFPKFVAIAFLALVMPGLIALWMYDV